MDAFVVRRFAVGPFQSHEQLVPLDLSPPLVTTEHGGWGYAPHVLAALKDGFWLLTYELDVSSRASQLLRSTHLVVTIHCWNSFSENATIARIRIDCHTAGSVETEYIDRRYPDLARAGVLPGVTSDWLLAALRRPVRDPSEASTTKKEREQRERAERLLKFLVDEKLIELEPESTIASLADRTRRLLFALATKRNEALEKLEWMLLDSKHVAEVHAQRPDLARALDEIGYRSRSTRKAPAKTIPSTTTETEADTEDRVVEASGPVASPEMLAKMTPEPPAESLFDERRATADWTRIRERVGLLAALDRQRAVFGARRHDYRLRPVLTELALEDVERRLGVRLPPELRHYYAHAADGGAGPYHGVLRASEIEGTRIALPFVGVAVLRDRYADEEGYFEAPKGAISGLLTIAHEGCGHRLCVVARSLEPAALGRLVHVSANSHVTACRAPTLVELYERWLADELGALEDVRSAMDGSASLSEIDAQIIERWRRYDASDLMASLADAQKPEVLFGTTETSVYNAATQTAWYETVLAEYRSEQRRG